MLLIRAASASSERYTFFKKLLKYADMLQRNGNYFADAARAIQEASVVELYVHLKLPGKLNPES